MSAQQSEADAKNYLKEQILLPQERSDLRDWTMAQLIAFLYEKAGLSIVTMAQSAGVDPSNITHIKNSSRRGTGSSRTQRGIARAVAAHLWGETETTPSVRRACDGLVLTCAANTESDKEATRAAGALSA